MKEKIFLKEKIIACYKKEEAGSGELPAEENKRE